MTERIINCLACHGTGVWHSPRTRDSHGTAYKCHVCLGRRVVLEVTTVTIKRVPDLSHLPERE